MSENVMSYGFMAPLKNSMPNHHSEEWEELQDKLYEEGTGLSLNYEGTLIFSDHGSHDDYHGAGIVFSSSMSVDDFIKRVEEYNLPICKENLTTYFCTWYNGTDSDMSMMELKDFLKRNSWLG